MNRKYKVLFLSLLMVLFLSNFSIMDAYSKTDITKIIYNGSKWAMNINGEVQTLVIGKGKIRERGGGLELDYDFNWGDKIGYLIASSDSYGPRRTITFNIKWRANNRIICGGNFSRNSDDIMAGTCGKKIKKLSYSPTGAWYATRGTKYSSSRKDWEYKYNSCIQREENLKTQLKSPKKTQKSFVSINRIGNELGDPRPKSRNRGGIIEKGGVPLRNLPNLSSRNNDIDSFLNAYNFEFFRILQILFDQNDFNQYQNIENSKCSDFNYPLFCQMVVRQDAIYLMLRGNE